MDWRVGSGVNAKRIFDAVLAAVAVAALSPLFLVLAVLVRADSPGPVRSDIDGLEWGSGHLMSSSSAL